MELLSISAGESDYEADRVSCLHTVCLELEPIIFQLDLQWGPVKLVECFKGILDKTAKDPTLLKKLVSNQHNPLILIYISRYASLHSCNFTDVFTPALLLSCIPLFLLNMNHY